MKAKDRKEFERLIGEKYPGWDFQRQLDGGYVDVWLDGAWTGWCLRAAIKPTTPNRGWKGNGRRR